MDQETVEDLVYRALSHTEWKKLSEIRRAVGDDVPSAQLYIALDRGKKEGWVEQREYPQARLGMEPVPFFEWRLKPGGLRKPKKRRSFLGWLFPKLKEV